MDETAFKLYRILTFAEDALILSYTEIPLYAVRLLLYLYHADNNIETVTTETIHNEFHFQHDSKINRIMHDYMRDYIDIHRIQVDGIKKPINRYTLTRRGRIFVEQLLSRIEL